MVEPELALAPVIPPVTDAIVHAKVLGVKAAKTMFGLVKLQIVETGDVVTIGIGLTVTKIE